MVERVFFLFPPSPCYCGTKAAALRIANEVWRRVFAALCVCVCVFVFVWGKNTKSRKNVSFETLLKVFAFVFFVSFGVLPFVGPSFTLTAFHPVLAKISKWNCCIICTFRIFICVCPILPHRKKFSINFARLSFGGKQSVNKTAQDEPQFPTRLDLSSLSKRPTKRKLKLKCCQDICWIIQQLVPTAGNSSLFQLSSILFLWAHSFFFLVLPFVAKQM